MFATLPGKPAEDSANPFPSSFVACTHGRFKVRIHRRQPTNTSNHEPVRTPEATKCSNQFFQRLPWIGLHERAANAIHQPSCRKIVKKSFEKAPLGAKLIEDRHSGYAGVRG